MVSTKKLNKLIGKVGFCDAMVERDTINMIKDEEERREEIARHHEEEFYAGVL